MQVIRNKAEAHKVCAGLRHEGVLGLVPTMGFLHDGHLSLIKESARECHHTVVSIFVNPAQFGPNEDLSKYPRDENGDLQKCQDSGADMVFIPDVSEMYPAGSSVFVTESWMSSYLCGKDRPTHFRGVLSVVAKLFNILIPDVAYFGKKDYQQGVLIQKMVRDLDFGIEIKLMPIVRERDGVAMSSRNAYLNKAERNQAVVLRESLIIAEKMYSEGEHDTARIKAAAETEIKKSDLADIVYIELRDAITLEPVESVRTPTLLALAVKFGATRLIDNTVLGDGIREVV